MWQYRFLLLLTMFAAACVSAEPSPRPLSPGEGRLVRAAWWAAESGDVQADLRVAELLREYPESVDGLRLQQNLALRSGEDWRVYEDARRAHRAAPNESAVLYLMARLVPDRHEQRELFERCIRLDPSMFFGHYGHAVASLELGDRDSARESARRALVVRPGNPDARLVLAEALGPLPEAAEILEGILAEIPGHTRAHLAMADRHRRRGEIEKALAALLDGLHGSAAPDRLCYRAVDMILDGGIGTEGVAAAGEGARKVLGANPDGTGGNLLLAAVLREQEDNGGALSAFARAVRGGASVARAAEPMFECAVLSGDYRRAREIWYGTLPRCLLDADGNERREMVYGLREALDAAAVRPVPRTLLRLARALSENGFSRLAARVAGLAAERMPDDAAAADLAARLAAWVAFLGEIRSEVKSSYARRRREEDSPGLEELLESLRDAARHHLGFDAFAGIEGTGFPFIGEVLRTDEEGAPAIWEEHGTLLVLGRQAGGPVEATALRLVGRYRGRSEEGVAYDLVVGQGQSLRAFREEGGARIAGFTLPGWVVLNLDVVNRWDERMRSRGRSAGVEELWPSPDEERRRSLWFPGDVVGRLARIHFREGADEASVMSSLAHECGHIVDLDGYFPLLPSLPRALCELALAGFSPSRIEVGLETKAEEWALRTAPSPRNALLNTLGFLPHSKDKPPHSVAYGEIVARLIETIDEEPDRFPSIDRGYNLLQQLDRLTDEELRYLIDRTID